MYAPYDKTSFVIEVPFDPLFTEETLRALKFVNFNFLAHSICQENDRDIENNKNISNNIANNNVRPQC